MSGQQLVAPSDAELRARTSLKWSRVAADVIAADIAELDFRAPDPVLDALSESVTRSDFGYPDYSGGTPVRLAEIFAERMYRRHGWTPAIGRVETCGQIMQALCCAIIAYTRPGDCVLTHAPTYAPVIGAITGLGRACRTIPAEPARDLADLNDMARLAEGSGEGNIRMIVLCHPHNPTGRVFDGGVLAMLAEFAERHGAVVFSDEIYQDLVYDASRYCPPACVSGLAERTVTFTSAAKSFSIAGLRCAVGHFGSDSLHEAFCRLPQHLRGGASLPGIAATMAAWTECDGWLDELRSCLAGNRQLVAEWVTSAGGAITGVGGAPYTPPEATYFAWLDFSRAAAGADPRSYLLGAARVAVQSGASFGEAFSRCARLNFGTSPSRLRVVLDRIIGALGGSESGHVT